MKKLLQYASLVKFAHTLFALPFAVIAYFYALSSAGVAFDWLVLIKILLAMVFARNTAMGFNRYADRNIDAANPRTKDREIPAGVISPRRAMAFVIVNGILFALTALWINRLAFFLSPVALLVLIGYSFTKRFTMWSHVVLGVALGIAPVGAYIAVTGSLAVYPVLLMSLVITWVSGFDIIYSMQDMEFDRANSLHSIPSRMGMKGATVMSIILHIISVYAVVVIGIYSGSGTLYKTGAAVFVLMLVIQHVLAMPGNLPRFGATFGLVNGITSVCYAIFTILDFYF